MMAIAYCSSCNLLFCIKQFVCLSNEYKKQLFLKRKTSQTLFREAIVRSNKTHFSHFDYSMLPYLYNPSAAEIEFRLLSYCYLSLYEKLPKLLLTAKLKEEDTNLDVIMNNGHN